MPEIIDKLTEGWKKELLENDKLEKLWHYYEIYNEEAGELIIQVKDEWEDFINVYQIIISVSKIEFENNQKPFSPFLSIRKSSHVLEYKRYEKLYDLEDIMYKIEDFISILPVVKEKEEEKEEEEKED